MTFTLISSCSRCEFNETNAETGIFRRILRHEKKSSDCSVSNGYFILKRKKNDNDDLVDDGEKYHERFRMSAISQVYMISFGFFFL